VIIARVKQNTCIHKLIMNQAYSIYDIFYVCHSLMNASCVCVCVWYTSVSSSSIVRLPFSLITQIVTVNTVSLTCFTGLLSIKQSPWISAPPPPRGCRFLCLKCAEQQCFDRDFTSTLEISSELFSSPQEEEQKTRILHLNSNWWLSWLVAWHSGRTSVSDRRTFAVLRSICGWRVTTYVGKPSAVGQPTRPTQPFILSGR